MDREQLRDEIISLIREELGLRTQVINENTSIVADFFRVHDLSKLIWAIENDYAIVIEYKEGRILRTIGDLINITYEEILERDK